MPRSSAAPLHVLPSERGERPLDLREAGLQAGYFAGADLTDADLRRANLQQADLTGAQLRGARLAWADLTCASLHGADLRNADLSHADLSGADLRDADLTGALLDDATLAHAHVAGAHGLSAVLRAAVGRMPGPTVAGRSEEPQAGLDAFARGRTLHAAGRLAHAERAYLLARAWQPDSDIVPYALACLALDRDDPHSAQRWLEATLEVAPEADRALLELTLLAITTGHQALAVGLFAALRARVPELADLELADAEPALRRITGDTALLAWLQRRDQPVAETVTRAAEGHAAVAEAIAAGALAEAEVELRRLDRHEPLVALWRLLLPKMAVTAQAFDALLTTRQPPLAPVEPLRWQALGAHGMTARLETADGVVWAQRMAGPLRSAASLAYTHAIQELLAAQGFAVPHWLGDGRDEPLLSFDGDWLQVSRDLGGQPLAPTLASCAAAGRTLAQVHLTSPTLAGAGARPPGGLRVGVHVLSAADPGALWLAELAAEPALLARMAQHPLHARVPALLELTARRLREALPECPRGLCHGDFALHNLLLRDDGTVAILDWDLADWQPLAWDVARALDVLAVRWPPRAEEPAELHAPRLRAFLAGYEAIRPLLPVERRVLPLLVPASRLDLDTGLLLLLAPLDPDVVDALLPRLHARMTRAAAGMPEWPI